MRCATFLLFIFSGFLLGCESTTRDAQELTGRTQIIQAQLSRDAAISVRASTEALTSSRVVENPNVQAAIAFNQAAQSSIPHALTYEETLAAKALASNYIAGVEETIAHINQLVRENNRLSRELGIMQAQLDSLMGRVFEMSYIQENTKKETLRSRIASIFRYGGWTLLFIMAAYILLLTGILPVLIKGIAYLFPKLTYKLLGVVRREVVDKMVVGIGEFRKQHKNAPEVQELDKTLKGVYGLTSKEYETIELIRKEKQY